MLKLMNCFYIFLILLCTVINTNAQVKIKFELQNISRLKDSVAIFFLAGNFNSWKPADQAYKFSKIANVNYTIDKQFPVGYYEYKITRGSWSNAETGIQGNSKKNRTL